MSEASLPKKVPVTLTVNGTEYQEFVEPRRLLTDFLRHDLGLTGTHVGCEHGVCGACTILLDGAAVRGCLLLAVQAAGADIQTIEGIAAGGELHPIQQAFWDNHALQCGFCTAGIVLSTYELLERNPAPTDAEIEDVLGGHLCRCTGYQAIVRAMRAAADRLAGQQAAES